MAFINIIFHNKIRDKINEHKSKTGASRTFIAEQIGMSRQNLNSLENSTNPNILTLIRLAVLLKCNVNELFSYDIEVIKKDVET
jgi:DNA-binding XRE family transcriptional regulator